MTIKRKFPKHLKIATVFDISNMKSYFALAVTELLSQVLKFSYEIHSSTDKEYGRHLGNGNWTGVVGMLQRGECDVTFDQIVYNEDRSKVVNFSYPVIFSDITFVKSKPQNVRDHFAIIYPFSYEVWVTLGVTFFIVVVMIYLSFRKKSRKSYLLSLFGSILAQSTNLPLNTISNRILILPWFIGVMFLINFYKAVFISSITIPSQTDVRNIPQLAKAVEKGKLKCKGVKGSYLPSEFLKSTDESIRNIGKSMVENSNIPYEGEEFLTKYPYVAVYVRPRNSANRFKPNYFVSDDSFFTMMSGSMLNSAFCCRSTLDTITQRMFETGIYKKIHNEVEMFTRLKNKLQGLDEGKILTLSIDDFEGAFMILLMGYALGFACLCMEKMKFFFR